MRPTTPIPSPLPASVVPYSPALMAVVSPGAHRQGVFIRTGGHHTHPVSLARLRNSTACLADSLPSRSSSIAAHLMQRAMQARTARAAMRWGSVFSMSQLSFTAPVRRYPTSCERVGKGRA